MAVILTLIIRNISNRNYIIMIREIGGLCNIICMIQIWKLGNRKNLVNMIFIGARFKFPWFNIRYHESKGKEHLQGPQLDLVFHLPSRRNGCHHVIGENCLPGPFQTRLLLPSRVLSIFYSTGPYLHYSGSASSTSRSPSCSMTG